MKFEAPNLQREAIPIKSFFFLILFLNLSCSSQHSTDLNSTTVFNGPKENLNFEVVQKNLLQPYCIQCHNPQRPSGALDLTNKQQLTSLVTPFDPNKSDLYLIIQSGEMPPRGTVPTVNLEILKLWIQQGAAGL